jgi:hypothetical protein
MKPKPDVSGFSPKQRDPDAFLEGAVSESPVKPGPKSSGTALAMPVLSDVVKPEPIVQKLFRLRWDSAYALKLGAAHESAAQCRRVTETEIVERLLRDHYKLDS